MKLITELKKPYTEEERCDFIVEQNHNNGYEIRETEDSIQAWGLDDEELLEQRKQQVRSIRNSYLEQYVDPKQLILVWENLSSEDKKDYADYRQYLLDYTKKENWWENNPLTFDEWKFFSAKPSNVIESEVDEDGLQG